METIKTERYAACFELYLRFGGRNLSRTEREMRFLGYADFNRRILYGRRENGVYKPGWIEKYGWNADTLVRTDAIASATIKNETNPIKVKERAGSPRSDADFQTWLKSVSPNMNWDWKYQKYIYKHLQRVTDGTCKRLMIFLPPRHGKSELVTVRYAGWRLWNDPKMRVIISSYNQKLADKFSRSIRSLLSTEEDKHNPQADHSTATGSQQVDRPVIDGRVRDTAGAAVCTTEVLTPTAAAPTRMFPPSRTINTASQWETALGGGVKAVGVGAGVTGFGAQLVVIDDPVKSRAEAESETYREKLWNWYNNDLYTRLEPDASIVLIQTRWHQDDLAGRLLREMQDGGDKWDVINLPALAENNEAPERGQLTRTDAPAFAAAVDNATFGKEEERAGSPRSGDEASGRQRSGDEASGRQRSGDELGRTPGAALCPDRFDENKLADIQRQLGSYSFSALYQQRPTPAEGGIFKRAWFDRIIDRAPDALEWKRGYDLAVSTKTSSCFTASFRVAIDKETGNMYIADGFRKRLEYPDQKRYVIERVSAEINTEHGIEKALHGQALIQDLRRETRTHGKNLRGIGVTTDKVTRALKWAPLAEEGKIILINGPWIREFLDEVCQFPGGQFDDQIDAVSLAVTMFDDKGKGMWIF